MEALDLTHRLHVLASWKDWPACRTALADSGAVYRVMLDGCAITIRALCESLLIKFHFGKFKNAEYPESNAHRIEAMMGYFCKEWPTGRKLVEALEPEARRCLIEVLFLANRAVAHLGDDDLSHLVGENEMTVARQTMIQLVQQHEAWAPQVNFVRAKYPHLLE